MKRLIAIFSSLLLLLNLPLKSDAQQYRVQNVELDSLVSYIRNNLSQKMYYASDPQANAIYSVSGGKDDFLKEAISQILKNGYQVSIYNDAYFITKNNAFSTSLPLGYFESGVAATDSSLLKYLQDESTTATFQNKIYEIGDRNSGKKGNATVSGYVRDLSSGEPIVGAYIYEETAKAYAQTDASGFYRIVLPIGENHLGFSGYSLEDININMVVYDNGNLDVVMKERVYSLTGAVVTAENQTKHRDSRIGIEKIYIDQIKNVPTVMGESDVIKVILTLPGVQSTGEASNGFNVRGGAVDQNLILFNNGTIFNPNHLFGLFSAFDSDLIQDVELYKSSIPVEFGGRASSVLEVKSKEGNSNKITGSVGLGALTSRFNLEGPIVKGKTTFVTGGRMTYSDWLLNFIPDDSNYANGAASFYDYSLGLTHKFNSSNTVHAYGYISHDSFKFTNDLGLKYNNRNFSVDWRSNFSDRHSMTLAVGYDGYQTETDDSFDQYASYCISTLIQQGYLKLNFKSVLSPKHTLTYGASGNYYDLHPGDYGPLTSESLASEKKLETENAVESAVFASDTWQINDKAAVEAGLRGTLYSFLGNSKDAATYVSPEFRLSGKYSFTDNFTFKAGFNGMNQYIHMISNSTSISMTDTWKLSTKNIKPQKSWQLATGLYLTKDTYEFTLEGYFKRMRNYLDYKAGAILSMNENLAEDLVPTLGKAYGAEFMAKKTLGKLNGWVSYTYSRTFLKEKGDRGINTINGGKWYSASYDKPHNVQAVANYKFTHRYSISVNVDYSTGRPITLPLSKYMYGGSYRFFFSDRNGYRIPDYFRMDCALNIEPGHYLKQLMHMSVTLGVYNVTGRHNAYSVYFQPSGNTVKGNMLCVFAAPIPYINLNLKF